MNWTPPILAEAEHLYLSRNSIEIASELSQKYGCKVTPCTVRAALSKYGIEDTKRLPTDIGKAQRLIRKFLGWHWNEYDIAEQLSTWHTWVRSTIEMMKRPRPQLSLWSAEAFTIPARPMRVVHVAKKVTHCPWVQLEFEFEPVAILKAA